MREELNFRANTDDFEFEALRAAENYRQALFREFGPWLAGQVIEVGAGVGQMSELLVRLPAVRRAVLVEPDPAYCARLRTQFPGNEVIQGTAEGVPSGTAWDAVLSVNVLEHIREDAAELERYAELLRAGGGALCLFVPARPEIYAPLDRDFGHFRRYRRSELRGKLVRAGFVIERLYYFNLVGYFAWWLNFCLFRKRAFEPWKVRLYDRRIFPAVHAVESRLVRPPFGQSLLAVARSGAQRA
jgi:SAM-dependent methyltransferase